MSKPQRHLSSILSMISDYGVNLTEIHSRPFEEGDTWNYRFFAELSANMDTKEIRALLYQLSPGDARTANPRNVTGARGIFNSHRNGRKCKMTAGQAPL